VSRRDLLDRNFCKVLVVLLELLRRGSDECGGDAERCQVEGSVCRRAALPSDLARRTLRFPGFQMEVLAKSVTGFGGYYVEYVGGIYMASNVDHSCRVWPVELPRVAGGSSVSGGDAEHLRGVLGPGLSLLAGDLVWMSDATPHESMPLAPGTERQFFRLVTSGVGVWWARHSTPNPLGVEPDCPVLEGDKFEARALEPAPDAVALTDAELASRLEAAALR
jgi:hypothetical protein